MPAAFPRRPFTRVNGSLDHFIVDTETRHISNEVLPGARIRVSGWIVDEHREHVETAWVNVAGIAMPVELNRDRPDVARAIGSSAHAGVRLGFTEIVQLAEHIEPGSYDARVIGLTRGGGGVYGDSAQRISIAHPQTASKPFIVADPAPACELHLRDTEKIAYTLGRGAHTVRQGSSLHLSGFVDGAANVHVTARASSGVSVAWNVACRLGRFDALLWLGELERGLYHLSIGRDEGESALLAARCFFDIAGPHYLPPMHLTTMYTAPACAVTTFEDASATTRVDANRAIVAGRPIAVSGWCLDPASGTPPLAVCVQVDAKRPVPLSHGLSVPLSEETGPALRCGFGGIIDTTRLEPGMHDVAILAAAVSGAGWYVADRRRITLCS